MPPWQRAARASALITRPPSLDEHPLAVRAAAHPIAVHPPPIARAT